MAVLLLRHRTDLPMMTESNVREFISTGVDPLAGHVERMEEAPFRIRELLLQVRTRKHTKGKPLLLLRSLTEADMMACVSEVIEKCVDIKKNRSKKENVLKQRGVVEVTMQGEKKKKGTGGPAAPPSVGGTSTASSSGKKNGNKFTAASTVSVDTTTTSNGAQKKIQQAMSSILNKRNQKQNAVAEQNYTDNGELDSDEISFGAFPRDTSDEVLEMRPASPPKSQKPSSTRPTRKK